MEQITRYVVICHQLESNGKYDENKKIEITNNITNIEIDLKATNLIIERDKKVWYIIITICFTEVQNV